MMPLPSEEVTPPVTNMYLVLLITGGESTEKLTANNGEITKNIVNCKNGILPEYLIAFRLIYPVLQ